MKFQYLGNIEEMTAYGYDFSNGQTPDVTDEKSVAKLLSNSHFQGTPEASTEEITEDAPRPKVADLLPIIKTATREELDKIAEGETRETVLNALAKRREVLAKPE